MTYTAAQQFCVHNSSMERFHSNQILMGNHQLLTRKVFYDLDLKVKGVTLNSFLFFKRLRNQAFLDSYERKYKLNSLKKCFI